MITEHYAAVLAHLEANPKMTGRVHDTALQTADGKLVRGTYWVLFGGKPDILDDGRQSSPQHADADADLVYTLRSVSTSATLCRAASAVGFQQLIGFVPDVEGRSCTGITFTHGEDPEPDNEVNPPLFYCDDEYTLHSSRA